jgi:hypothetical protein
VNACKAGEGGCAWAPPVAPPVVAECPAPLPDRTRGKLIITMEVGAWHDATLKTVMTCDYCAKIGMGEFNGVIRCGCPMRKEDDLARAACELYAMGGAIVWQTEPAGRPVELKGGTNPWVARCDGCEKMRVCAADGLVCSDWR